ncbi:MAG: hypothetical protein GY743_08645 [Planctomycetaceae bacterium]|nr:hypothetical protein [Planctomycetaceae bacterium]
MRSNRWTVNIGTSIVVLNCCPTDSGALTQVVWDIREEDVLLRTLLAESLDREWNPWGGASD